MKTVVIIYAVSWLILLIVYVISKFQDRKTKKKDDALEKFLNARKSTKEKIVDKLVYVIMIVFAPLVVFVVPYILIILYCWFFCCYSDEGHLGKGGTPLLHPACPEAGTPSPHPSAVATT